MVVLAVVDTNVVVSGLLSRDGDSPTARILDGMLAGSLHFVLSDQLLAEYRAVLLRPAIAQRHGLSEQEVDRVLEAIVVNAGWRSCAETTTRGDAHVTALLHAESNAVLVTGDAALLGPTGEAGSTAYSPTEFCGLEW